MSVRDVDSALRGLGLSDRVGALILNLCAHHVDSIMALQRLIATVAIVGKNLKSDVDRQRCAAAVHECAVEIESEHRQLVKIK
jgi:hypothetical protein